jgi:hypothetical protein
MEAIRLSERSVDFQRPTWHCILEVSILHNRRCENPKSYNYYSSFLLSWSSYLFQAYGSQWPLTPQPCSLFTIPLCGVFPSSLLLSNLPLAQLSFTWRRRRYVTPKRWHQPDNTVPRPSRDEPRPYRCSRRAQARDLSARESRSDAVRLAHAQSL